MALALISALLMLQLLPPSKSSRAIAQVMGCDELVLGPAGQALFVTNPWTTSPAVVVGAEVLYVWDAGTQQWDAVSDLAPGQSGWVYPILSYVNVVEEQCPQAPPPLPVVYPHRWYTSDESNAAFYYCDDDPGWQQLSPAHLHVYPTVAALLQAYPVRIPHRACADGTTGP